jgi:UDP-N-acetylmuramoyl-L-alanyl-D-glutamate--2,6-diaminopimelate ligase
MVRLSELIERLGGEGRPAGDGPLADVHIDSRRVGEGALFCALPGLVQDGARFALEAVDRGAAAILSPEPIDGLPEGVGTWVHPEARRIAGEAAALVYGRPSSEQAVIGVTGTNGKSTVVHLIGCLLRHAGRRPGLVGTVEVRLFGDEPRSTTHTTPDATELQRLCKENQALGGDTLVLEASSHAIDQERLAGLELDVAVFTNLSRDHLDYHPNMDAYAAAKEGIFSFLKAGGAAAINADDAQAERMCAAAARRVDRVVTYGIGSRGDLSAFLAEIGPRGSQVFLEGMGISKTGFFLPLVGRYNVENALAALAAVLLLGASPSRAFEGLASVSSPRGRLEAVDIGNRHGFQVFVDYAHTPDALERVLGTLREIMSLSQDGPGEDSALFEGRLICVFGCGGNRDREKREPMGRVVGDLADLAVVTSDNPRHEDPDQIIADIQKGLAKTPCDVVVEADRRLAIREALRRAEPGDVVLIAGKGHEAWQLSRGHRLPFEDSRVVGEELP